MPVKECGGISRGEVKKEGVGIITRFVGGRAAQVLLYFFFTSFGVDPPSFAVFLLVLELIAKLYKSIPVRLAHVDLCCISFC